MKTKQADLNIDLIGGQVSLTVAEEKAISEYFRQRNLNYKETKNTHRF
jgi:hypothetical protein